MMFYGIIFLFLDFFSKEWMKSNLILNKAVTINPRWIQWHLIHNSGMSFGLLSGYTDILTGVSFIAILTIYYLYRKVEIKSIVVQIGFALVLSGSIGNFIDRLWFGYVIDFIEFCWWPAIFNVADIEIRTGIGVLIGWFLIKKLSHQCVSTYD